MVTNTEGKKRLVVNLRFLYQYLLKEKFKYEDLRTAMLLFQKGDFLITFDLKSGYHHIDIHKQHWMYLGFSWALDHEPEFYAFCVLPFGLATACYVFTKVKRSLVKYWRQQGIRVVVYLDDGLVAVEGVQNATKVSTVVQQDLIKAGWVENVTKSEWVPSQQRS